MTGCLRRNGRILPSKGRIYEIGSITKTFTASLPCKAVSEGRVRFDDPIDAYLQLEGQGYAPTIGSLATHTSGYKEYYFETPMISNFLQRKNSFTGIYKQMLRKRIDKINLKDADFPFVYSNFGFAVLGAMLEEVYDEDYAPLMNAHISEDLGLRNTRISDGSGDLGGYWEWRESDAYMPAGALFSEIAQRCGREHADLGFVDKPHGNFFEILQYGAGHGNARRSIAPLLRYPASPATSFLLAISSSLSSSQSNIESRMVFEPRSMIAYSIQFPFSDGQCPLLYINKKGPDQ